MIGIAGICFAFTKTCTKYVKASEKIYDMTHEELKIHYPIYFQFIHHKKLPMKKRV